MVEPRILHVTREFSDRALGGIEQSILLAASDTRFSHQILTLGYRDETSESECQGLSVFRIIPTGSLKFFPLSFEWFRRLRRLTQTADIVHLHSPFPLGELSIFFCGRPVICTYHSDIVNYGWFGWLYQVIQRWMMRRTSGVIATSPAYVQSSKCLKRYMDKLHVVPFGLPLETEDPVSPNVRVSSRFFLFLGSRRRYKGLSVLLEASRLSGCSVVVAGAGQTAPPSVSEREQIVWLDSVTEAEKVWLLKHADALVLPSISRAEAFGIVLLEAMRVGCPCIVSKLGTGVDWVVVDPQTGFIVEPNNPKQLADVMLQIHLSEGLREQMGSAGRTRFEQNFSIAAYHEKLSMVYWQVLG